MAKTGWTGASIIEKKQFRCGHCEHSVASRTGWKQGEGGALVRLCPNCDLPTIQFADGRIWPRKSLADHVPNLAEKLEDEDVAALYEEVREASKAGAHTAAELLACALVARIGVQTGGAEGLSFMEHVMRFRAIGRIQAWPEDLLRLVRRRLDVPLHRFGPLTARRAGFAIALLEELAGVGRD